MDSWSKFKARKSRYSTTKLTPNEGIIVGHKTQIDVRIARLVKRWAKSKATKVQNRHRKQTRINGAIVEVNKRLKEGEVGTVEFSPVPIRPVVRALNS